MLSWHSTTFYIRQDEDIDVDEDGLKDKEGDQGTKISKDTNTI